MVAGRAPGFVLHGAAPALWALLALQRYNSKHWVCAV